MKNLIKTFALIIAVSFASCNTEVEDHVTGDANTEGAIVKILPSSGKTLGVPNDPSDLENTLISFAEVELDLTVALQFGGQNVTKYEIVKSLNGGAESVVASGTELPLTVNYSTIDEFMSNTEITDSNDLRIGDEFKFKTKIYTNSGTAIYASKNGTYTVIVNCSSNLAGDYYMDFTSGRTDITITEVAPGVYRSDYLPPFVNTYWFEFTDVCSSLSIVDWQYQDGNSITPFEEIVGYLNEDGNLVFEGINVAGVSWYVSRDFTIIKN